MRQRLLSLGQKLLTRWVGGAARRPLAVLAAALALTLGAGYAAVANLGINTDITDMLSEDLPFRQNNAAVRAAFPRLTDVLLVVVEAASSDAAADAAGRLAEDLSPRAALFHSVFYAEGDPYFRRNGLLYLTLEELQALADRLARAQPLLASLSQDMSLRGLAEVLVRALGEDIEADERRFLMPLLERMSETARALAAAQSGGPAVRPMSWSEILSGDEPTPDTRRRFILVQPVLDYASLEPAARAIDAVRQSAAALGLDEAHGARVRLTGSPAMFQDELRSVRSGIGWVGLASLALVTVILAAGLRAPRDILAVLATLLLGLVWTAGFAAIAVGQLNLISVAFAVLFIGLSVDFGIHFVLRYREVAGEALAGDASVPDALAAAARGIGGSLTLTALAAAIGFFAFYPTSYRGLSELGLISGVGMFIALFANLTLLPALLRLLAGPRGNLPLTPPRGAALAARLQRALIERPRPILAGAALLGLGALAVLPFARFDDDPLNLRDPNSDSVSTLADLTGDSRIQPYSADLLAPDLERARVLAAELRQRPQVEAAITPDDLVPEGQDQKLALIEEMSFFLAPLFYGAGETAPPGEAARRAALDNLRGGLREAEADLIGPAGRLIAALDAVAPTPQGLAALETALLGGLRARLDDLGAALEAGPVGLDDLPEPLRARYLAADGRVRIEIVPSQDLRDPAARRDFVDAVTAVAPTASGAPITITEAGRAVVRAFIEAAGLAVVAIVLLLLAVLRSPRDTMLVLAPLVLAALLTVAATVVLGVPFNFANVIVLPLLLGLGVAGGIHVVARTREAGPGGLVATSTPRAVLLSALTTIASFCALGISSHRGTASMGVLLTIAIALSLATTLIVLPALLDLAERRPRRAGAPT